MPTMNATLLDQFLAHECTPYLRTLVRSGMEAGRSGAGPRKKHFEFDRFDVTFDLDAGEVVIQDVLDATGVQHVPIAEFSAALDKWR